MVKFGAVVQPVQVVLAAAHLSRSPAATSTAPIIIVIRTCDTVVTIIINLARMSMAVDLCTCFTNQSVPIQALVQSASIRRARSQALYVVAGEPRPQSADLAYFALWADDEDFDLGSLCRELSLTVSPICAAWKAEHAGMGGYVIYSNGAIVDDVAGDEDYLLMPMQGAVCVKPIETTVTRVPGASFKKGH